MHMSGYSHAPAALSPSKYPLVPIPQEGGWAPDQIWTLEDIIIYLCLPVFVHRIVQPVAQSPLRLNFSRSVKLNVTNLFVFQNEKQNLQTLSR
jgi:hypothetical protein